VVALSPKLLLLSPLRPASLYHVCNLRLSPYVILKECFPQFVFLPTLPAFYTFRKLGYGSAGLSILASLSVLVGWGFFLGSDTPFSLAPLLQFHIISDPSQKLDRKSLSRAVPSLAESTTARDFQTPFSCCRFSASSASSLLRPVAVLASPETPVVSF